MVLPVHTRGEIGGTAYETTRTHSASHSHPVLGSRVRGRTASPDLVVTVAASHYRPSNVLLVTENAPLCCVEPYRRGHQSVIDKVCA